MNKVITAIPTKSGNGFIEGKPYIFTHENNGLYKTEFTRKDGKLLVRYVCFDLNKTEQGQSAHLWDGRNWDNAGQFIITEILNK